MSFIKDVDSLRAKAGVSRARLPIVVGLLAAALLVAALVAIMVLGAFSSPGVTVEAAEEQAAQEEPAAEQEQAEPATVYVHVAGAVNEPGLYAMDDGARLQDAIEAAGGFADDAQQESVNLARAVADGEQIVVTRKSEAAEAAPAVSSGGAATGKVNINTADAAALTTLDGVGDATAAKIIAYREANGPFKRIEDIKEVSGIGDKKFEGMKDSITV